jgi:hypothetical protein
MVALEAHAPAKIVAKARRNDGRPLTADQACTRPVDVLDDDSRLGFIVQQIVRVTRLHRADGLDRHTLAK